MFVACLMRLLIVIVVVVSGWLLSVVCGLVFYVALLFVVRSSLFVVCCRCRCVLIVDR